MQISELPDKDFHTDDMFEELKEAILTEVMEDVTSVSHETHDDYMVWVLAPSKLYDKTEFLKSCVNSLFR